MPQARTSTPPAAAPAANHNHGGRPRPPFLPRRGRRSFRSATGDSVGSSGGDADGRGLAARRAAITSMVGPDSVADRSGAEVFPRRYSDSAPAKSAIEV